MIAFLHGPVVPHSHTVWGPRELLQASPVNLGDRSWRCRPLIKRQSCSSSAPAGSLCFPLWMWARLWVSIGAWIIRCDQYSRRLPRKNPRRGFAGRAGVLLQVVSQPVSNGSWNDLLFNLLKGRHFLKTHMFCRALNQDCLDLDLLKNFLFSLIWLL